jgi:signal transduction histidine kinase
LFVQRIVKNARMRLAKGVSSVTPGAAVVLVFGTLLTLAAASYVRETTQAEHEEYFERRVAEAQGILTQHLRMNLEVLRGLQALFVQAGERPVARDEFRRYAGHLNLESRYPGIRALTFTRYVRDDQLAAYEAGIRRDPALRRPDFVVKPVGSRADYFVADFISPANTDDDIMVGIDLGSEANRRATLERARDTGLPTASQLIRLTMRQDAPTGFFVAAPVYRPGAALGTVAERQRAFLGCVTAVFGSEEMMTDLFGARLLNELDIEIYDSADGPAHARFTAESLLFDSAVEVAGHRVPLHAPAKAASFYHTENVGVADRQWSVVFTALPALAATQGGNRLPEWMLIGGGASTLLLFALITSIFNANRRLECQVAERTVALTASNRELAESVSQLTALNQALQKAHSQLLQSDKMASLGQLAAGVAHEINNPIGFVNANLGTLRGYIDDLLAVLSAYQRAEPALADHPELLSGIATAKAAADLGFMQQDIGQLVAESLDGVQRIKMIVQDLKNFSRVGVVEWRRANLERGLDSTLNMVRNEIKYKAEVIKDYAGIPEIECIGSQLNQVFMNLLVNAAQAIETKGTITIRTGANATQVWVEITDTGKGMPPDISRRIFEPFFTTKPVGQGTGLGLSLAYGIIERHCGSITVESEVGRGTRFLITVPRERMAELAGPDADDNTAAAPKASRSPSLD